MEKLVAFFFCGLACDTCPVYLATREKVKTEQLKIRLSIADQCNKIYKLNLGPEDINDCDGCGNFTGRLFTGCKNCEIRKCAMLKKIESCAFCSSYPCESLEKHFVLDPQSKIRLEGLRVDKFKTN